MYSKIKQFLDAAPRALTSANEIYNFARNRFKQIMGVFPDGLDDVFLKRGAAEMQDVRQKVVKFPEGGKDKTDFFSTRPDPRLKQPEGAKMDVQRAHENLSGGSNYAKGDTKYNADVLADEIARQRKLIPDDGIADSSDLDFKTKSDLYSEAYSYLTGVNRLNKPKKGGLMSTIEGETRMRTPEEIMEFLMRGGKGKAVETEAEMLERMNRQNKETVERIKKRKEKEKDIDPEDKADGGRIGFGSGGLAGFAGNQMEQYSPGVDIPGSPQVPMGQIGPANVGIFGGGGYSKNQVVPGVNQATTNQNYGIAGQIPIGNTGFTIGGDYMKSRVNERFTGDLIPNQVFKNVPTDSDRFNVGINFRKQFKDGSKPKNPGRRTFMKGMAGLAALPFVGKFFKPAAKVAEKVTQLKNTSTAMPEWFPKFIDKFINRSVGKKIDQDIMEFKNPDLPNIKVTRHDDGRTFVEGNNEYNEGYAIDYTPPGYEVIDETTGKAVKTKGEFEAVEGRHVALGPEDYDTDPFYVDDLDELTTIDVAEMEKYSTGKVTKTVKDAFGADTGLKKGPRDYEMAVGRAENEADVLRDADLLDEDLAKGGRVGLLSGGGLAYMLGE